MAIVFDRKYYKYTYGAWTQPVLTSNTSSTLLTLSDPSLSGSTIDNPATPTWGTNKVTNFSTLFNCMDSSTTNYFTINSGNRTYTVFDIEFSNKLKISQIYIAGNVVAGYASSMTGSIIYDMSSGNPVLLSSKTDGNYNTHTFSKVVKKIRVCIRPNNDGTSFPSRITAFTITAQQVTGSTESTASNYDFIKDIKVKDVGEHGVYLGSQNTNCLIYTPKNVNLTLSNGTLTLKAGSKVYVPNGKNADGSLKFDEVVIANDITYTNNFNGKGLLFCFNGNSMTYRILENCFSGTTGTIPTFSGTGVWYDTTNNKVKLSSDGGNNWVDLHTSLPIGFITVSNGAISNIDQIFDWCGCVGRSWFIVNNVKGLQANGLNADGTYKSASRTAPSILVQDIPTAWGNVGAMKGIWWSNNSLEAQPAGRFTTNKTVSGTNVYSYVENENQWYYTSNSGTTWIGNRSTIPIVDLTFDGTRITSLTPYTAQPETTAIPIDAIYYGSQLVYQYHPYEPNTLVFESNAATTKTISLHKGVYEVTLVGGGGGGGAVWVNGSDGGGGGSGACVRSNIRLKTGTYTFVCGGAGAGGTVANSGVDGDAGGNSTLSLNGSTLITAGGGGGGLCGNVNGGLGGAAGTYNIASSVEVVKTILNSNGNAGGTGTKVTVGVGGASVAGLSDYPDAGRGAGSRSNGYNGFIRLRYIGA